MLMRLSTEVLASLSFFHNNPLQNSIWAEFWVEEPGINCSWEPKRNSEFSRWTKLLLQHLVYFWWVLHNISFSHNSLYLDISIPADNAFQVTCKDKHYLPGHLLLPSFLFFPKDYSLLTIQQVNRKTWSTRKCLYFNFKTKDRKEHCIRHVRMPRILLNKFWSLLASFRVPGSETRKR